MTHFWIYRLKKTQWNWPLNAANELLVHQPPHCSMHSIHCCFVLMCICSACTNMNGDTSLPTAPTVAWFASRTWVNQDLIFEDNIGVKLLDKKDSYFKSCSNTVAIPPGSVDLTPGRKKKQRPTCVSAHPRSLQPALLHAYC